ncbi:MAG TPA: hypothetical protein VFW47_17175 [Phenylobacterium sp.]|nr:hypothetical protein [Phenylobacterium sp.]
MAERPDDIWFLVFRNRNRLRAWPVNWKGWASLIGVTLVPTALFIALTQSFGLRSPWLGAGYLCVALPAMFFTLSKLFKAKGQNV